MSLQRVLICPDVHVPYHDSLAFRTFLEVARRWKPHCLVILGDFVDFYQVSQFPKDPARKTSFSGEIEAARVALAQIERLKINRVVYCEGNHETRLKRYIANAAPELDGLVDVKNLLDVRRRGWEWVPYGHYAKVGKLHFMHDAGHAGAQAPRQSVAAFGGCIIFGHTHRAGSHYESTVNGDRHVGMTCGWLGDPEAIDYRHRARVLRENQHGFGVAHVEQSTGLGWCTFVPILNGRAVVDGKMYDGRNK